MGRHTSTVIVFGLCVCSLQPTGSAPYVASAPGKDVATGGGGDVVRAAAAQRGHGAATEGLRGHLHGVLGHASVLRTVSSWWRGTTYYSPPRPLHG